MIQQSNRVVGEVAITHANIKYGHIYLSSILDAFPEDTIGGTNKMQSANATLSIDWGGKSLVETDIDGRKKIFRARAWVRDFFDRNSVRAGDDLVFERIATRVFKVRVKHRAGQTGRPISQA